MIKPSNVSKKKVREPSNVRKELSYVILELHNVKLEPSNVKKKIREPSNVKIGRASCRERVLVAV